MKAVKRANRRINAGESLLQRFEATDLSPRADLWASVSLVLLGAAIALGVWVVLP